ncbi:MAG: ECs_2282 family putative zinc-binding protein [Candidatus Phlomobacter fragariae]
MCNISFKCPGCGHDLVVKSIIEIKNVDDIEGTVCTNCSRAILKSDIVKQSADHAADIARDIFGKNFK